MSTSDMLLGLLSTGPRHGYELKHAYDGYFPQARPLAYGQVYATLSRLARDGLIEVAEVGTAAGPERTVYTSTAAGKDRLDHWLTTVEAPAPHTISVLMAKVVVALLAGGVARDYLHDQRAAHLARMRDLVAIKSDPRSSVTAVVSADYALVHLDADLRWIDTTTARLDELAAELRA